MREMPIRALTAGAGNARMEAKEPMGLWREWWGAQTGGGSSGRTYYIRKEGARIRYFLILSKAVDARRR